MAEKKKPRVHVLTRLKLREVSLVDVPANPGARALLHKYAGDGGSPGGEGGAGAAAAATVGGGGGGQGGAGPTPADARKAPVEDTQTQAALAQRCADLQRENANLRQELAFLADRLAALTLAQYIESDQDSDKHAGSASGAPGAPAQEVQGMTTKTPEQLAADQEALIKAAVEKALAAEKAEREALAKRLEDAEKRAQEAEKRAAEEAEKRALTEATKRAETLYPSLPGEAVVKGCVLRAIEQLPEDVRGPLEAMLKAGEEALRGRLVGKSAELGSAAPGPGATAGALARLRAKAEELVGKSTGLSYADAFEKACEQNPELYAEYRRGVIAGRVA